MERRPLKILAVNKFHMLTGGADTFYVKLNEALRGRGHRVVEFSTRHPDQLDADPQATFVWGLKGDAVREASLMDIGRAYAHGVWNREAARAMEGLLDRVRPDVVHVHNIYYQLSHSIVGPIRRLRIPIVLTLHDYHPVCANNYMYFRGRLCDDCKRGIGHILFNRCFHDSVVASSMAFLSMALRRRRGAYLDQVAHVVSPSRFLLTTIREFGVLLPPSSVLPVFYEAAARSEPASRGRGVLYLGQLQEQKGVRELLAIAANSTIPFVFAGRGPLQAAVEQVARERRNVLYAGFLLGADMDRALRDCFCLAVPSLWYENAPAVILDAYARRRPVVASSIGGIPELVDDNATGILVPPGDRGALLSAIEALDRDPLRAARMGQAGRARLGERHSKDWYLDQLEEIYWSVVR